MLILFLHSLLNYGFETTFESLCNNSVCPIDDKKLNGASQRCNNKEQLPATKKTCSLYGMEAAYQAFINFSQVYYKRALSHIFAPR